MTKNVVAVLVCLCLVAGVYGQLPVTDGLIIHLRADSITGLRDGDPVTLWIDLAQDDPVDGTVRDVGSGTPEYKAGALYGKPVVRFNGAEGLSSAQFDIPDRSAGVTAVAVATGDKSGILHERLAHFGAYDAVGGSLIALDVCTQQGVNEGSGFRLNNGWACASNPNPMDTNFHVGVWQAAQGTKQSALVYYVDGVKQTLKQNNPNNTVTFKQSGNVVAVGGGHSPGGAFYSGDYVTADLAVLIVYNRVLSAEEVTTLTQYLRNEYLVHKAAANPQPASETVINETHVTLTWDSGEGAGKHRVYVAPDLGPVAKAEPPLMVEVAQPPVLLGTAGQLIPEGLWPGFTYHWRVDEVTAAGEVTTGPVWSFSVAPPTAYYEVPEDGRDYARLDQTLTWKPGLGALLHTVYVGADAAAVAEATGGTAQAATSYTPQGLEAGKTYYWRVDETTVGGIVKGPVWSFTTVDAIAVQDDSLLGWWTMDQVGSVSIPDMSGHNLHGAIQGRIGWSDGVDGGAAIELRADALITTPPADVNTATITMTAWIKPAKVHGRTGIIFMRAGTSTTGIDLMPDNQLGYHWLDAAESWQYSSDLIVPVDEWSFVAMVVVPEKVTFYLDGVTISRELVRVHNPVLFNANMTLGSDTLAAGRRFVGALDDLRFYNRALSQDEVAGVAAAGTKFERPANSLAIDDFDSYNTYFDEDGQDVWDVWSDGYGGNGTGSTAGYTQEPLMSRNIVVHDGQSLPLGYNNTGSFVDFEGKTATVLLSEISRSFSPAQDLTRSGSTGVTLWIHGDATNTVQAGDVLYLGVKDASGREAVTTVAQPADLLKFYWLEKTIPLTQLAGVDLTKVTQLLLGVGTRAAPVAGGSGTILIDSIVLTAK